MKYYKFLSVFDNEPFMWRAINEEEHYTIHISKNEILIISIIPDIEGWISADKQEVELAALRAVSNVLKSMGL